MRASGVSALRAMVPSRRAEGHGGSLGRRHEQGETMGFLIRSAFWFSLVLLVIPFGATGKDGAEPGVGPVETFLAAQAVIGDVAGLCEQRPDACEFGREAMHTIGVRARESARVAYGMLDEHFSKDAPSQVAVDEPPLHTGSIELPAEAPRPFAN